MLDQAPRARRHGLGRRPASSAVVPRASSFAFTSAPAVEQLANRIDTTGARGQHQRSAAERQRFVGIRAAARAALRSSRHRPGSPLATAASSRCGWPPRHRRRPRARSDAKLSSPWYAAQCNAVAPSACAAFTSAPLSTSLRTSAPSRRIAASATGACANARSRVPEDENQRERDGREFHASRGS